MLNYKSGKMKKVNEQINKEESSDQSRRNFFKTLGVGALGITGMGFSIPVSDSGLMPQNRLA
jgi:hypothetical protein